MEIIMPRNWLYCHCQYQHIDLRFFTDESIEGETKTEEGRGKKEEEKEKLRNIEEGVKRRVFPGRGKNALK